MRMFRKSIVESTPLADLTTGDQKRCQFAADLIIIQCLVIFVLSITVLRCLWKINLMDFDYYKLACIMYLYDKSACGYKEEVAKSIEQLKYSNDTLGFNILPIRWKPPIVTVSTRLSTKTRTHIEVSVAFHTIWCLTAIVLKLLVRNNKHPKLLALVLTTVFYVTVFIILFDFSMAIVYVAHIKQSLTQGMIVRYSGWNLELSLENYDSFAGWLPLAAGVLWLKGIVVMTMNILACKRLHFIRMKMKKREISRRYENENSFLIPQPRREATLDSHVLYYRAGERKPYTYAYFN